VKQDFQLENIHNEANLIVDKVCFYGGTSAAFKKTLRVQDVRRVECGIPFCQSCPLANIILKRNLDLVFHQNLKEALNQLLQTNNFPGESIYTFTKYILFSRCLVLLFNFLDTG
jgi:NADPH-dependent glutamate synthase beta subunit-like oxidoreductase